MVSHFFNLRRTIMETVLNQTASIIAISFAGIFFLIGLLTGAWKYHCMAHNAEFKAPHYVDVSHRASLIYSFAAMLIAVFAALSAFPAWLNISATIAPLLFFAIAILNYIKLGLKNNTNNQLRDSENLAADKILLKCLMIAEIGGFVLLLIGFFVRILG
jgi:uncharacterized membrane protein YhdT